MRWPDQNGFRTDQNTAVSSQARAWNSTTPEAPSFSSPARRGGRGGGGCCCKPATADAMCCMGTSAIADVLWRAPDLHRPDKTYRPGRDSH